MALYYVNKNAQANGDHEVHTADCAYLPNTVNRTYLGDYSNCYNVIVAAKTHYRQVNGCYYCCEECHTG